MKHLMNLCEKPFLMIKNGFKRVEMRLYDEKRKLINKGDEIEFESLATGEKLIVMVNDIKVFKSFEELYKNYDKKALGYLENESANHTDMLQYYPSEDMQQNGVCAIEIKLKN